MNQLRLFLLILSIAFSMNAQVADLVIFSYDRPMQLYALLESIEKNIKNVGKTTIIYRASDVSYKAAYGFVGKQFPSVELVAQGTKPQEDFKPLTLQATFDSPSDYILFAVDDIIVKDTCDLATCIEMLEQTGAYGFYLRLGDHLNFCYSMNKAQAVPELANVQDDVFSWQFSRSEFDWAYPHTVDMTLYRKKDIEPALRNMEYHSPNSLEGQWASRAGQVMNQKGLCFKNSKIVNLPLNKVQKEYNNRSMSISTTLLLKRFMQGYKIALDPLFQVKNASAHMEYEPMVILRTVPDSMKGMPQEPEPIVLSEEAVKAYIKKQAEEAAQEAETRSKKEDKKASKPKLQAVKNELLSKLGIDDLDALVGTKVKKDPAWYKKIAQLDEKPIVIVTASYKNAEWYKKNLDSVFDQNYTNWHLIYMDDCSPDGTGELVKAYVKERGFEDKVTVVCNKIRRKAMANLYTAIYMCAPQDIVVILDGDDWLAFPDVLKEVNFMYSTYDVWLTYGQFKEYPSGKIGFCKPYPAKVVKHNDFRTYAMGPSHLRTFYAGLFHKIELLDLLMEGEFFPMTYDLAMMLPMMEMVGEHHMCCDTPLLEYNTSNPINDHKVSQKLQRKCDKIIRSKPKYDRVESPF